MRLTLIAPMLFLIPGTMMAQQHVIRNSPSLSPDPNGNPAFCGVAPGRPECDVLVYDYQETDARIKAATIALQTEIGNAKTDLAKDINEMPPKAVAALRSQIKEQIKAEILQELIEDIKAGKLKLPSNTAVQMKSGPKN